MTSYQEVKISRKEIFSHNSTCRQHLPGEKMPDRCVVAGCSNGNDPERNISLHKIPYLGDDRSEAKARRKKWVDFVKLKRAKWEPTVYSRVCSVHFSNTEDFEAQFSIPGVKRQRVQSNLYITALYIAVTLCITVTEQLPKNRPLYFLLS